jgi:hypothetical protein
MVALLQQHLKYMHDEYIEDTVNKLSYMNVTHTLHKCCKCYIDTKDEMYFKTDLSSNATAISRNIYSFGTTVT